MFMVDMSIKESYEFLFKYNHNNNNPVCFTYFISLPTMIFTCLISTSMLGRGLRALVYKL